MFGVWVFKNNGVVRLVENPGAESLDGGRSSALRKVLVHTPTNEVITSYSDLERKLSSLGWERYYDDPNLLQFHKRSTVHLISLPRDFGKFKSMHMYDIVVKTVTCLKIGTCNNSYSISKYRPTATGWSTFFSSGMSLVIFYLYSLSSDALCPYVSKFI